MAGKSKEERLREVHARALERFDRAYTGQREIRLQCAQDRRFVFVPGAQYDGDIGEQFANRARFEINKMHQAVLRTFSEYRNNRVTVDFRPADDDTSDDTAEFLDGLYRGDEQESGGQEAYDTAFEEGVAGGFGAWRLMSAYEDDEDEDDDRQRIRLVPIPDADQSVFFDADAKRYDKADAMCGWIITGLQDEAYEDQAEEEGAAPAQRKLWTDRRPKNIASFDKVSRTGVFDWFAPDVIYVVEYFEVELVKDVLTVFKHVLQDEVPEERIRRSQFETKEAYELKIQRLKDQGYQVAREKKIKTRRVHKYLIDGNRVLEDCGYIAGKHIPIVPYYAKRQIVDGVERVSGRVRLAIDAQRLYNMLASMLAEIAADSVKEKPIFTPEQIAGHEDMWARDNIDRFAYLLVNPMTDAAGNVLPPGPLGYTKSPAIPPALAGLIQLVGADLQELLGTSGDQQEVVSNISAKAVELIQNRLDMADFIFMDNLKQSMRRSGEIWHSMARDLYDEDDRPMRVVNPDGSDEIAKLRQPKKGEDEKVSYVNDPAGGKFRVIADVGPSFTTRRDGTVRAVTGMLQFVKDPTDQAVLTSVAVKNLEGEGLEAVKKHFRMKLLTLGLEKPNDEEATELKAAQANQQPDAQQEFLMAEAQKSLAQAQQALAKAKEAEASAAEKLAKVQALPIEQLLALVDRLPELQQAQPVAQAPAEAVPA